MTDTPAAPGTPGSTPDHGPVPTPDDHETRPYPDLGRAAYDDAERPPGARPATPTEPTRATAPPPSPPPSPYAAAGPVLPPPPTVSEPAPARTPPRGRARMATVVVAALIAGAAAGVGGAAAWDAWGPEDQQPTRTGTTVSQTAAEAPDRVEDGTVEAVAQSVLPSVVKIDVTTASGAGSGSGIILNSDGLILTNNHVIEAAADDGDISVSFDDGSTSSAEVLGADPLTDTAVIQADDVSGLTAAAIGKSGDLQVGQDVVAVGSPFGLDATVTSGIVSALNRPVNVGSDAEGNSTTYPAIQTDAAINPGNSGGPLVDMNGNVVGINSSIRTSAGAAGGQGGSIGLGFAIPIDEVLPIVDQMSNGETPTHARLGVQVENAASGAGGLVGARLAEVDSGSAAAGAGLEPGDVITRVNGRQITGSDSLVATIRSFRPGDDVEVTFVRDGDEDTASLTLDSDAD